MVSGFYRTGRARGNGRARLTRASALG